MSNIRQEAVERAAAICERLVAATPGPWDWGSAPHPGGPETTFAEWVEKTHGNLDVSTGWAVWCAPPPNEPYDFLVPAITGNGPTSKANAEFIANARDDTEWLLDQLTEAIAQRDEALERTRLLANARERWGDDAAVSWHADTQQWSAHHRMYHQDVRVARAEQQLATERGLCDRAHTAFVEGYYPDHPDNDEWLADYDARRTTERANTEKGDTDGVV